MALPEAQAGRQVLAREGEEVADGLIVLMRPGGRLSAGKMPARYAAASQWRALAIPGWHRVEVPAAEHASVGAALAADPAVELVEPDRIRRPQIAVPNDASWGTQWSLTKIRALQAWQWFPGLYRNSSSTLDRVRVAVLDSGVDCTHLDFANFGFDSTNTASGGQINWANSAAIVASSATSPPCAFVDDTGHGTQVAGLVAAATHNQRGVASLGYMLELGIFKITAGDFAYDSDIIQGIRRAVDGGARVINISYGSTGYSNALQEAVDYAWARNVLVVASAGNDGTTAPDYPASCNHVLSVGAFDQSGARAGFSNRGPSLDLAAPGVDVLTTARPGPPTGTGYTTVSGTSVASPQVAALAGLLMVASPGAGADDVARRMQRSADLASTGWTSDLGFGRIDAERALTGLNWRASTTGRVTGQVQDAAGLAVSGAVVRMGAAVITTDASGMFNVAGSGPGDYSMTVTLAGELTGTTVPVTVAAGGDTPVHVRLGQPHGTLLGTVTAGGSPAAGIVVGAWTGGAMRAVAVTNDAGQYRLFAPVGTYEVRAGGMFTTAGSLSGQNITAGAQTPVAALSLQNFGRVEGTVRDGQNAAVAGVDVQFSKSGRNMAAISAATGDYRTLPAPAGTYTVNAEERNTGIATPGAVAVVNDTNARYDVVLRNSGVTTVSPSTLDVSAAGGFHTATVTSAAYLWRATTSASWIHLYETSGRGDGAVGFTADANASGAARQATIQVNEAVLTVRQAVANAVVTFSPTTLTVSHYQESLVVPITSAGAWVAVSEVNWLAIHPSSASQEGSGNLRFTVDYNQTGSTRTGRIRINASFLTVIQPPYPISVSPESVNVDDGPHSGTFAIISHVPGYVWTARPPQESWLTITSPLSGQGNGTMSYRVDGNGGRGSRFAIILFPDANAGFVVHQSAGVFTLPQEATVGPAEGSDTFQVVAEETTKAWTATTPASWVTVTPASGTGTTTVQYRFSANPGTGPRTAVITVGYTTFTITQQGAVQLTPGSASFPWTGGDGFFTTAGPAAAYFPYSNDGWISILSNAGGRIDYRVTVNNTSFARTGTIQLGTASFVISQQSAVAGAPNGLHFVPLTPCRIVDTRENLGAFGLPALVGGAARSFPVQSSTCGIPAMAKAYALNVTVVPRGPLGYLTIFPAGQTQPLVSTLNSIDGRVKANAAIVPAGTNGAISVFATDNTDVVLDINGYFVEPGLVGGALAFYPLSPCRVLDTRNSTGGLGGPVLAAGTARSFPVPGSSCLIPPTARAYSVNATVVPVTPLGYLTLWPSGTAQPFVSTLNAPTGGVVANAAIVPAGDNGSISAFATSDTHLIIDVNGYFAPPGSAGSQKFYPVAPCRVLDSRDPNGAFGGPVLSPGQTRSWPMANGACGLPASATAFSLNATVVPTTGLGYLTMWPGGVAPPLVSTLNATGDPVVANAAIVATGAGGAVSTFVTDQTHLIVDTNGFFAP